jgi:hypothetical protein
MNIKSMKYLLIILFCFESINSYTQKSNTIYNTTVDKATKVEVKGGVTNIKKADTVLIQIFSDPKSKIYLTGATQIKDSSGMFITTFHLKNPYSKTLDLEIEMIFDNPYTDIKYSMGVGMAQKLFTSDNKSWGLVGSLYSFENGGTITVTSSTPIKCTIKGIEGFLEK